MSPQAVFCHFFGSNISAVKHMAQMVGALSSMWGLGISRISSLEFGIRVRGDLVSRLSVKHEDSWGYSVAYGGNKYTYLASLNFQLGSIPKEGIRRQQVYHKQHMRLPKLPLGQVRSMCC